MKQASRRMAAIVSGALFVVICILTATSSGYDSLAANGILTPRAHLPFISRQKLPTPYNLSARSIVLQPSDLPGYSLAEGATGPADFLWEITEVVQMGLVDGYRVWYNGVKDELTVYELVTVFETPQGAHSYIQWEKQNLDPACMTPVSCPKLGDETIAYCGEDDYWALCDIVFRKGNLAVLLSHGGIPGKVKFGNALSIARVALARVNSQTAEKEITSSNDSTRRAVAANGTSTPWAYLPYISKQEPPTPTPTPTPTPIPQGVYVLPNHSHYYFYGGSRSLCVVGEVHNNTDDNVYVKVVANFFDSDGRLVEVEYDYVDLWPLPAGEKACFWIWTSLSSGDWSYYQFEPPSHDVSSLEPVNLTITSHNGRYSPWSYIVRGFVRNDYGRRVEYPGVISTLYDASGTVVGCSVGDVSSEPLNPGQTSSFEVIHFYDGYFPDIASYRLQTDGDFE